ncbi:MAG: phosphotransferase family protein [Sciscionella sp.]
MGKDFGDWPARLAEVEHRAGGSGWLNGVAELAAESVERCGGTSVAHFDLRDDNVLITDAGQVYLCDWNWPLLGAPWVDLVCLLCSAYGDGLDADALLRRHPLSQDVDPRSVDALLANLWLYFAVVRHHEVPASSPYIRVHQAWYAEVIGRWLAARREQSLT